MSKVNEKYPDLSTNRAQRILIWIICIVMAVGFLVSLFVWVLAIADPATNPNQIIYEKANEKAAEEAEAERAKLEVFNGEEATTFNAVDIKKLQVKTIKEGNGETVAKTDTISAYYTGWLPDGTIFDSTKSTDTENESRSFALDAVITGWTNGLSGKKVGGIYELTIPANEAYGETGIPPTIPANTPLRFIVEIVSKE